MWTSQLPSTKQLKFTPYGRCYSFHNFFKDEDSMPTKVKWLHSNPVTDAEPTSRQPDPYHTVPEAPKAPTIGRGGWGSVTVSTWELINHLENSSKCNMAWRLGSHWSHGPVYITAISWAVSWKDVLCLHSSRWTATWNLTFAAVNAEQIPYNKAYVGTFSFSLN